MKFQDKTELLVRPGTTDYIPNQAIIENGSPNKY
jgi:hypothetical protein